MDAYSTIVMGALALPSIISGKAFAAINSSIGILPLEFLSARAVEPAKHRVLHVIKSKLRREMLRSEERINHP
jgi:hypothetical protein